MLRVDAVSPPSLGAGITGFPAFAGNDVEGLGGWTHVKSMMSGRQTTVRGRATPHVTCFARNVRCSYAALASMGFQMLILRVSGIRKSASTKHTAGTAIG